MSLTPRLLSVLLCAGALLLSHPGAAQFGERIEVSVVGLDVVVTDRSGKPVRGLSKADFEIFENGKLQPIANFAEVTAESAAAPSPASAKRDDIEELTPSRPRQLVFFIDCSSLHPLSRQDVLASVDRFIETHARPEDRMSLVSWDRSFSILQPFTSDRESLRQVLRQLTTEGSPRTARNELEVVQRHCTSVLELALSGRMPMPVAYQDCINTARLEMQETMLHSRGLVNALEVSLATMSGLEGKKALIIAGARLPIAPGVETFELANQLFGPYLTGFNAPRERPPADAQKKQRKLVQELGAKANASGVTMYLVAAGVPSDSVSIGNSRPTSDGGSDFLRLGNTEAGFAELADMTGGIAVKRASRFDLALDTMADDLGSYYSLAYRPVSNAAGERKLEVRTRNRNYSVRSKRSWTPRSADDEMKDRVITNVYSVVPSERKVILRTGDAEKSGDKFQVPIEIEIAPELTLVPSAGKLSGGFTVYVAVGNDHGALSTVFHQANPVAMTPAEETGFRSEPLIFTARLTVRPGQNHLSVGVRDQVDGSSGFARTTITAQ